MAQLCGLFDNGLEDLVEVESGTRDRCERATEGCQSRGFALLFCFDRTILLASGPFDPVRPGSGSRAIGGDRNGRRDRGAGAARLVLAP
jgi:hypothetical protein